MSKGFTFRPVTKDEYEAVTASINYAFAEDNEDSSFLDSVVTYCAFDGDKVAATSGYFPFENVFNGQRVRTAGVTIVTTEPEYRRQGLVRRMMTDLLHQAKNEGYQFASLWASMGALYQRYGYGLASHFNQYSVDPRFSTFRLPYEVPGTLRRMDQDEAKDIIRPLFERAQAGRTLDHIRTDFYWDMVFSEKNKKGRNFVVYYDTNSVPQGYSFYRQKHKDRDEAGPTLELMISDFIWTDMDAYHGLWSYYRSHDLARDLKFYYMPDDDPAKHLLLEPRMLNKKQSDGLWLRVVDVPAALAARGYTQSGEVTVCVEGDDLCPWNNGSWRVSAGSGGKCGEVRDGGEKGLTMNPNTLSSLVSGFQSASALARAGQIACDDEGMLAEADRLFSTIYQPHCSMEF